MSADKVRELRHRFNKCELLKVLANDYNISISYVFSIGHGYSRKEVE